MDEKVLKKLEYDIVLQQLADFAGSELGKKKAMDLRPLVDADEVIELQADTAEGLDLIISHGNPPIGAIYDSSEYIRYAVLGSVLTPIRLLEIADTLRSSRRIRGFLSGREENFPRLFAVSQKITVHQELEKRIEECIIGENTISDNASARLNSIRRNIERKQTAIRDKLSGMINSARYQKMLQENIVTIRNNRFVLPIKSEYRGSVGGMVHDQSAKGSTVYIEPAAVVNLNNDLAQLEMDERDEIQAILRELTEMTAEIGERILENTDILVDLEFLFAKAKLAMHQRALMPRIKLDNKDGGSIRIRNGRHPMLAADEVVPTNIWIGDEFTSLLITGPNTGGKTVTLKTVGLFVLMAQSGLHLPADHGTELSIFDGVYADIGDEQSIAQNLSTFSSHMTNIVGILKNMTPNSLVLFDELGAGTDPTEGAALGIAILEHLRALKIRTIATTHYAELKHYALSNMGVENACMEFDVATLSPTYRLLVGIPGKSNAFEISEKLGLSGTIIEKARSLLSTQTADFEAVLAKIEESRKITEKQRELAIKIRLESQEIKKKLEEREARWVSQRDQSSEKAKTEARAILRKARDEAAEMAKMLRKIKDNTDLPELDRARARLGQISGQLEPQVFDHDATADETVHDLDIGDTVMLLALRKEAKVLEAPNEKGEVLVMVGSMKMHVEMDKIEFLRAAPISPEGGLGSGRGMPKRMSSAHIRPEIDLRGKNIEEAVLELDKYIDDVLASSISRVRIIHGKGTGALRHGLHDYFKTHRNVKEYELAAYNEGGSGVTILTVG